MFREIRRIKNKLSREECIELLEKELRGVLSVLDAVRRHDKVSFCVYDQGFRREGEWALNIKSVIVFGRMEEVKDTEKCNEIYWRLSRKFVDDDTYTREEIARSGGHTMLLALVPEHISGKIVNES